MKILTLNTHSLVEEHYEEKLAQFAAFIQKEQPDILALQEVNQSVSAPLADPAQLPGYMPCEGNDIPVRSDNHAARTAQLLHKGGFPYFWTWLPAKIGYDRYDEGMAIFSRKPISQIDGFFISKGQDYQNWRTRKTLGIRPKGSDNWYYTVHMGWWSDPDEPFQAQWQKLAYHLQSRKETGTVWLMGDFNSPAEVRAQGYDCICRSGWYDTWALAEEKDNGITVDGVIDGWRELLKEDAKNVTGMRIDHIWCSSQANVQRSRVIFNGTQEPVIYDQFGVLIEATNPTNFEKER